MRPILILLLTAAFAAPAAAQLSHKCGNEYQATPCPPKPSIVHGPGSLAPTPESAETMELRKGVGEQRERAFRNQDCVRFEEEMSDIYDLQARNAGDSRTLNERARRVSAQRQAAGC